VRLAGRSIFVTGASRGIGRAIAVACAREGGVVGVGYHRSADAAASVVAEIAASSSSKTDPGEPATSEGRGRAFECAVDVSDPASVDRAIASFADATGGRLDAVVANAAALSTGLLATADMTALESMIDTNVLGPIACARAALPLMLAKKRGVLLFVGSIAASRPARGQAAYAASKAAVEALTRAIAVEYGRKGIRAVCIRPGAVDTDMLAATRSMAEDEVVQRIPMRRVGTPDEIARVAAMLLSDDAAYVNGAVIDVDGGYAAS